MPNGNITSDINSTGVRASDHDLSAVDVEDLVVTVTPAGPLWAPLDAKTELAGLLDTDWNRSAYAQAPLATAEPDDVPFGRQLKLTILDEPFEAAASPGALSATLELAYSIGGWTAFDEVARAARADLPRFENGLASDLEAAIGYTGQSIASLAGNYLLQLEQNAEQLLKKVLEERVVYIAQVRADLLEGDDAAPKFKEEDDSRGGRQPIRRARQILADLECIDLMDKHVSTRDPVQTLAGAIAFVKRSLDPLGGFLAEFSTAPQWIQELAERIGLGRADIEEPLSELRRHWATASALNCALRVRLMEREPVMSAIVMPVGRSVPISPAAAAGALAQALDEVGRSIATIRKQLEAGELSIRDKFRAKQQLVTQLVPVEAEGLLEQEGFFDVRNRPEWVWAHILDGGPLQPAAQLPHEVTLWNLGYLVAEADRQTRSTMGAGRLESLAGTTLREMQQQRFFADLKSEGRDFALSLLLNLTPARPVYLVAQVLTSFCSFAATADQVAFETDVQRSDLAGAGSTLERLSDHAPDTLNLVFQGVNLASDVLAFVPRLKALQSLLDVASLGYAGAQGSLMILAMLAQESDEQGTQPGVPNQ